MIRYQIACAALLGSLVTWPILAQPGTNVDTGALTTNSGGPSSSDARLPQIDGRAGIPGISAPGQAPSAPIPQQAAPGRAGMAPAAGQAGLGPASGQAHSRQLQPGMPAGEAPGMQAHTPYTPMPTGSVAGQAQGMGAVSPAPSGSQPLGTRPGG